jgi:hypothetical protein
MLKVTIAVGVYQQTRNATSFTDVSEEQNQSSAYYLLHADYLAYSSGLKIGATCSSETSVDFNGVIGVTSKESEPFIFVCEHLKSYRD